MTTILQHEEHPILRKFRRQGRLKQLNKRHRIQRRELEAEMARIAQLKAVLP